MAIELCGVCPLIRFVKSLSGCPDNCEASGPACSGNLSDMDQSKAAPDKEHY